jgi:hypothetical protein
MGPGQVLVRLQVRLDALPVMDTAQVRGRPIRMCEPHEPVGVAVGTRRTGVLRLRSRGRLLTIGYLPGGRAVRTGVAAGGREIWRW